MISVTLRCSARSVPGGFGKTPGRHDDRSARSSLDWDRETASQEARLKLERGSWFAPEEPRWNADRRAHPLVRAASDDAELRIHVCRRSASFFFLVLCRLG